MGGMAVRLFPSADNPPRGQYCNSSVSSCWQGGEVTKPRPAEFKWRHFEPQLILMAVGWYLRFSPYRDVEELLHERGMGRITLPSGDGFSATPPNSISCCGHT